MLTAPFILLLSFHSTADDDNDLGLAHLVGRAYLPGITADTVQAAVDRDPARFYVAAEKGVFGAEECLRLLVSHQLAAGAAGASEGGNGNGAAGRSEAPQLAGAGRS